MPKPSPPGTSSPRRMPIGSAKRFTVCPSCTLTESQVVFSTHLLPLARGILSTIYVTLREPQSANDIEALYRKSYAGRPMIRIWPAGTLPELQHVAHTNFCDIGFALDKSGRR